MYLYFVAGVHHDKKKISGITFIRGERRRNEGRRKRGEEELVGRVVDRGENIIKIKEMKRERDKERREEEK